MNSSLTVSIKLNIIIFVKVECMPELHKILGVPGLVFQHFTEQKFTIHLKLCNKLKQNKIKCELGKTRANQLKTYPLSSDTQRCMSV